jgi:hypothetical protein
VAAMVMPCRATTAPVTTGVALDVPLKVFV